MGVEQLSLELLLDSVNDGVYVVDGQRRISHWNRAAEQLTGYTRQEALGSRCADNILMHVDGCGSAMCLAACPLQRSLDVGQACESDLYFHHKRGHRVPVHVRSTPFVDAAGKSAGAIEVFSNTSHLRDLAERVSSLERMAMLDQLTELPNRRYLEMNLTLRMHELARYGWPYGVLLIDLDLFKQINDTHGHLVGDQALQMAARTLSPSSRVFDVVGRWGGEEFLAIVSHVSAEQLLAVGERLRALIQASSLPTERGTIHLTVSIGAVMSEVGESSDALLQRADQKLYAAKQAGRNRVAM